MNFRKDINNTKLYKFAQIMIFLCVPAGAGVTLHNLKK